MQLDIGLFSDFGCGHDATRASRVRAIGKWMQRRLFWLLDLVKPGDLTVRGRKEKRVIDW